MCARENAAARRVVEFYKLYDGYYTDDAIFRDRTKLQSYIGGTERREILLNRIERSLDEKNI